MATEAQVETSRVGTVDGTPSIVCGLFAGIGGFELGFSRAGLSSDLLCEIDPAARAVLEEHFPGVDVVKDVQDLDELTPKSDLVTAGFPCQDLSSVGEKGGIGGDNSSLIGHVFRLLERQRIEWVVLENVPFMLQLNSGEAMHVIADSLTELGYSWAYRIVDTAAFGLPQRRRRVFVVASQNGDPRDVLLADDRPDWERPEPTMDKPVGFYWTEGQYSVGLSGNGVPPLKGGSGVGIPSPPAILLANGLAGKPDIRDAERLQGFDADWTLPAESVDRPSSRWRLVGNAVTVDVAEWLGERLVEPGTYDPKADHRWNPDDTWPHAAWSTDGEIFSSSVSHFPVARSRRGLDEFLEFPLRPLSVRATKGFLSRLREGGLSTPPGFEETLQEHAERMARKQ